VDRDQVVQSNRQVFAIRDRYPVTDGHLLIIPWRHTEDYFSMTRDERQAAEEMIVRLSWEIRVRDPVVKGFNVGTNTGKVAGQSVPHAHIHLIPRRKEIRPTQRAGCGGSFLRKCPTEAGLAAGGPASAGQTGKRESWRLRRKQLDWRGHSTRFDRYRRNWRQEEAQRKEKRN
jgi:diadenosine tetraphosphate (Ap4A) HIT family hydrolase